MFAKVVQFIRLKITNPLHNVSFVEGNHISKVIIYSNFKRLQYLLFSILLFSFSIIISDFIFIEHWQQSSLFQPFITADLVLFTITVIVIVLVYSKKTPTTNLQRNIIGFYLSIGAIWLGITSGLDYEQNYLTFIIGTFLLSGFFTLKSKNHFIILALLYGVFLIVHTQTSINYNSFTYHFVIPTTLVFAWLFGRNLYNTKTESIQKEYNLEAYTDNLYNIVKERTRELENKNQSLIKEIESKEILQTQLVSSQQLFAGLLQKSTDSIVIAEPQGNILQWNNKTEEYTGITKQQAIGKSYWKIISPWKEFKLEQQQLKKITSQFINELINAQNDPKPLKLKHWITANGQKRFVETKIFPISTPKRRLIGAISRNITRQLEYEKHLNSAKEAAEQNNKDKTDFLANVSHDLRSPLNSISGFCQILELKPNMPKEKQKRYLKIIYENSQYLLQLINSLIDLSKLQSGGVGINKKTFSTNEFIKNLNSIIPNEIFLQPPNITINQKHITNNIFIETDDTKLLQIYTNLIDNAIKFTQKGFINFGCDISGNKLHGYVEDSGVGMSQEELSQIYERFYSSQTKNNKRGKGIGLAIVKGYIDLLHGEITVKSIPGKGTRFDFSIPVGIKPNETVPTADIVIPEGKKVLIIDNNKETCEHLIELLTYYKLIPTEIASYEDYVTQIKKTSPDIILIDITGENNHNFEILKKIKAKHTNIPAIGYTAQSETDFKPTTINMLNVIIFKPINTKVLLQKLMQHIA